MCAVRVSIPLQAWLLLGTTMAMGAVGELELHVTDQNTGEPTAVWMRLSNARGRPMLAGQRWKTSGAFAFDGQTVLKIPAGRYTFELEKGPEYRPVTGEFLIEPGAADHHAVRMHRYVDMNGEGWWSGDLHVPDEQLGLPVWMAATDLNFVSVTPESRGLAGFPVSKSSYDFGQVVRLADHRLCQMNAVKDQRRIGTVFFFGGSDRPPVANTKGEYPAAYETLRRLSQPSRTHVHLDPVTHGDLPLWVASGRLGSVAVLSGSLRHERDLTMAEAVGQKGDSTLFPPPDGLGRWLQYVYFQLLETGHQVPPAAGSGDVDSLPLLGYNRTYVYCGEEFTSARFWQNLKRGQVVVTNGPLLRPFINGLPPGTWFEGQPGEALDLQISLKLGTREKIDYLEIIKNGRPVHEFRLDEFIEARGQLPPVTFTSSGWLLVRVVTEHSQGFRVAMSAPFYVQFEGQQRMSRSATEFFLDWAEARAAQIRLPDTSQQRAVMSYHRAAVRYWQKRLQSANVD